MRITQVLAGGALLAHAVAALAATAALAGEPLSAADIEALRELDQQQVQDWINRDRNGIWESLSDDAVFIPHHGVPPKSGEDLEKFWWPEDAPPFKIIDYWHRISRIEGEDDYGIVYGRQNLVFDWGDDRYTIGEGNYFIFAKKIGGEWKMKYIIATDPPNRVEPKPRE